MILWDSVLTFLWPKTTTLKRTSQDIFKCQRLTKKDYAINKINQCHVSTFPWTPVIWSLWHHATGFSCQSYKWKHPDLKGLWTTANNYRGSSICNGLTPFEEKVATFLECISKGEENIQLFRQHVFHFIWNSPSTACPNFDGLCITKRSPLLSGDGKRASWISIIDEIRLSTRFATNWDENSYFTNWLQKHLFTRRRVKIVILP